jgi:hypothetical protein
MFLANRFVHRCAFVCAIALPFATLPAAAQDAPDTSTEPGSIPGAEKSLLHSKANSSGTPADTRTDFCKCIDGSDSEAMKRIEQALRAPIHSIGFEFAGTPLQEVVSQLQDDYQIPIQIDSQALEAIGVRPDEPVNVNIHKVSLQSALRLMLKTLQLTYTIVDEVLMITTPDEVEKSLRICVYDVSSISGSRDADLDDLMGTITSCVATDTWAKNGGGEAEIRAVRPGMLVVSQTNAVQEEIRALVSTIQKMQAEVKPNQTTHEAATPNNKVVTRSYILQLQPNDSDVVRGQVRELILNSLPNETWSGRLGDGQAVTLNVIHDRVVVRHTPAVQEEVERILSDSGIATPANAVAANQNGFGGGGMGGGGGGFGGGGFFRLNSRSNHPAQTIQPGPASDNPFGE